MQAIEICDHTEIGRRSFLTVDLRDILHVLGNKVISSTWRVSGVKCTGGAACEEIERLSEANGVVSGGKLHEVARDIAQIVNGRREGTIPGDAAPWIEIDAVDSSSFYVMSNDEECIDLLRKAFKEMRDIPSTPK
jgi:hypothetical protein